jgi:alkylmercury lyase-like protein
MTFDLEVKLAIYRHFAAAGARPSASTIAACTSSSPASVREAFVRLRAQRVLVLEPDGESIRMAPPFSGVPTQHVVEADGVSYFANCAWDALGIPAALHRPAIVRSRCEQSMEPMHLEISADGPDRSEWIFHCQVPAAHWWDDIVFT